MSSVTLRLYEPDYRRHVIDGHNVSVRRLKGALAFGRFGQRALYDCVIDTGAYLTVVPQSKWYPRFQNDIHWLTKEADPLLPPWLHGITGIDAQTCRTRLGILPMQLIGGPGETLRWIDVTAHFLCQSSNIRDVLLGLSGAYPHIRLTINGHQMKATMEDLDL